MKAFSFTALRLMCAMVASMAVTQAIAAPDTTAPTLSITHTWIAKSGTKFAFNLLLDPRDETGINQVQHRFKINSTVALPDTTPWINISPWMRGQPLVITQACTSIVIEVRALDVAGNASPIQRRIFKAPFPLSSAPNFETKFVGEKVFPGSGPTLDCRGLFGADFDGDGRDDILQVDRASGIIKVRRQQFDGTFVSNGFTVAANAVSDSAMGDFNGDGRPDLALVISGALVVYQNDGLGAGTSLQFSVMGVQGLATTGISTVVGVAAGDVTGEGKADLVITGTGDDGNAGTVAKIAILLHNDQFQLGASNHTLAFPNSSAGQVRLGDVTGDGKSDAVMIDAANNQVLLFMNKGGIFGGADDAEPSARPIATATASAPAQAIAVGDFTGDGRADLVVTLHRFGDFDVTGQFRDYLFCQYFDSRGAAPFRSNGLLDGGFGPVVASSTPFRSDVMLQDLNDDGLPELVVTNPFQTTSGTTGIGGIRGWRFNCQLDNANLLTFASSYGFSYTTGAASPHRLAAAHYQSTRADVLLASGDNAEAVQFVLSTYTASSKAGYDLLTGASTDSDSDGSPALNGLYTYYVDVGGVITYSLNYANNSEATIAGAVLDCLLPPTVSLVSADDNAPLVPAGTSKYVRWSLGDVPAHTSGVKNFTVRVLAGKEDGTIALKGNFKRGTTVLVTTPMPVIILDEPLDVKVSAVSDSDSIAGAGAHVDEVITYRMKIKNEGTGAVNGFKVGINVPLNTVYHDNSHTPDADLTEVGLFNYTGATWKNLNLAPGATVDLFFKVKVKPAVATGIVISCNTITVTRSDGTALKSPSLLTMIKSPLEISISSNKGTARPGEIIRYTLRVQNWLHKALTFGRVVNELPAGTALYRAGKNDNLDVSIGGKGNFLFPETLTDGPPPNYWNASDLSLSTVPCYDSTARIMTWALGGIPADAIRNLEYEVIVAQDIPTTSYVGSVILPLAIQNKAYNFAATTSGNARIFAGTPKGGAAANGVGAHSSLLLSTVLPVQGSELNDPPLDAPRLVLIKDAHADGQANIAGQMTTTVINDTSLHPLPPADPDPDGFVDYRLTYFNFAAGTARNVRVRDYVPINMTFVGNVLRNGTPINTLVGCHFYDASGKEMQVIGAEQFTDKNGNGFYDAGEVFVDANGNKKYDGVTASLVKSIDFPGGDMVIGAGGSYTYRTRTTSLPGTYINSPAGGMTGVKNGLEYTKVAGYHLTADNLHFPVNGSPLQVKVLVTGPASLDFPYGVVKSRPELVGTEVAQIAIPYLLLGGNSLNLTGVKMILTIPKGYLVTEAEMHDKTNQSRAATTTRSSTGITTITFPINDWHSGVALFKVQLDPATKSVLKGPNGQIKAPLAFTPTLSGGYTKLTGKTVVTVAIPPVSRLLGALPVRDQVTAPGPSAAAAPRPAGAGALASSPIAQLGDSKIFVGRCAPISVKRGDTFKVTIFVGNLTDLKLGKGTIEMKIPTGCEYTDHSFYRFNQLLVNGEDGYGTLFAGPTVSAGKISLNIENLLPREGGAVTFTFKVPTTYTGTRIDDDSCVFDVVNASGKTPGPMAITVREGNPQTQSAAIIKSTTSGLGLDMSAVGLDF
ncbi:MAG: hypothetical protein JWO08_241, partial [Verrucomicrobiaceae bacterium]|nr:hypothetical protein [Verrucomicrobiaceae bacterium]